MIRYHSGLIYASKSKMKEWSFVGDNYLIDFKKNSWIQISISKPYDWRYIVLLEELPEDWELYSECSHEDLIKNSTDIIEILFMHI